MIKSFKSIAIKEGFQIVKSSTLDGKWLWIMYSEDFSQYLSSSRFYDSEAEAWAACCRENGLGGEG